MPTHTAADAAHFHGTVETADSSASASIVRFDQPDEPALRSALGREWLLTNGVGGFAMGSIPGVNTRRYHGLLVAAASPPVQRVVALHSVVESLIAGEETFELATHLFGENDMLHPQGWRNLATVEVRPPRTIVWSWRLRAMTIARTLSLEHRRNSARMTYEIEGNDRPLTLRLSPLTPLRDFHDLDTQHALRPIVDEHGPELRIQRDRLCLVLRLEGDGIFHRDGVWWESFAYPRDRERGQQWQEDVFCPGTFDVSIAPGGGRCTLFCALTRPDTGEPHDFTASEPERGKRSPLALAGDDTSIAIARLRVAADQFVVRRRMKDRWSTSIIAGYPWFADWGRDSMICLPGLLVSAGRGAEALEVLRAFASRVRNGLVPNRFDDYEDDAHYNSVDASLWFINALWQFARGEADRIAVPADLLATARSIITAFRKGISQIIHLDRDGLVVAGNEMTQLTWMDAKRDGVVFTPRHGKPIEVNALWHNALCCFAQMTGDEAERDTMLELAGRCAIAMQMQFWWPRMQCCHDVLTPVDDPLSPGGRQYVGDERLRPNQIFAASLPFRALTKEQCRDVVRVVGERLLTPLGLRSLDPADANYRGRFEGDLSRRDAAYHNGTVWPWLIGPYCEAVLRMDEFSDAACHRVRALLQPLIDELDARGEGCVNQLAEVYDGDDPRRPGGCPAQAWSVAEVLRILSLTEAGPGSAKS